jgi:hypothetical protein
MKTIYKFLIVVLAVIVVLILWGLCYRAGALSVRKANGQTPTLRTVSCVLKNTSGTWSVLDNEYHDNNGCTGVSQDSDSITVSYSAFDTVNTGYTEEDGTDLDAQVHAGNSVGLSTTVITLWVNGTKIDPDTVSNPNANFFIEIVGFDIE